MCHEIRPRQTTKKIKREEKCINFLNEFWDRQLSEIPAAKMSLTLRDHEVVEERFRWGRLEAELISGNSHALHMYH